jgi:myosin-crossreactive antigen
MISLQSVTHSSHMNTPGPAMSRRTLSWDLPQNEQRPSMRFGTEKVYVRIVSREHWERKASERAAQAPGPRLSDVAGGQNLIHG